MHDYSKTENLLTRACPSRCSSSARENKGVVGVSGRAAPAHSHVQEVPSYPAGYVYCTFSLAPGVKHPNVLGCPPLGAPLRVWEQRSTGGLHVTLSRCPATGKRQRHLAIARSLLWIPASPPLTRPSSPKPASPQYQSPSTPRPHSFPRPHASIHNPSTNRLSDDLSPILRQVQSKSGGPLRYAVPSLSTSFLITTSASICPRKP